MNEYRRPKTRNEEHEQQALRQFDIVDGWHTADWTARYIFAHGRSIVEEASYAIECQVEDPDTANDFEAIY